MKWTRSRSHRVLRLLGATAACLAITACALPLAGCHGRVGRSGAENRAQPARKGVGVAPRRKPDRSRPVGKQAGAPGPASVASRHVQTKPPAASRPREARQSKQSTRPPDLPREALREVVDYYLRIARAQGEVHRRFVYSFTEEQKRKSAGGGWVWWQELSAEQKQLWAMLHGEPSMAVLNAANTLMVLADRKVAEPWFARVTPYKKGTRYVTEPPNVQIRMGNPTWSAPRPDMSKPPTSAPIKFPSLSQYPAGAIEALKDYARACERGYRELIALCADHAFWTPAQKPQMDAGSRIPFSRLTPQQQHALMDQRLLLDRGSAASDIVFGLEEYRRQAAGGQHQLPALTYPSADDEPVFRFDKRGGRPWVISTIAKYRHLAQ